MNFVEQYPSYYPIRPQNAYDYKIDYLTDYKINSINLKDLSAEQNIGLFDLFYKTDHHWKSSTGLWVAAQITERLNELFDMSLETDLLNPDNYIVERHAGVFLGSQGKRVGKYYAGVDDYEIIFPRYSTEFDVEYYNVDEMRTGDFQDAFIFRKNLDLNNSLTTETNMYDTYLDGNHALIRCKNNRFFFSQKNLFQNFMIFMSFQKIF